MKCVVGVRVYTTHMFNQVRWRRSQTGSSRDLLALQATPISFTFREGVPRSQQQTEPDLGTSLAWILTLFWKPPSRTKRLFIWRRGRIPGEWNDAEGGELLPAPCYVPIKAEFSSKPQSRNMFNATSVKKDVITRIFGCLDHTGVVHHLHSSVLYDHEDAHKLHRARYRVWSLCLFLHSWKAAKPSSKNISRDWQLFVDLKQQSLVPRPPEDQKWCSGESPPKKLACWSVQSFGKTAWKRLLRGIFPSTGTGLWGSTGRIGEQDVSQ